MEDRAKTFSTRQLEGAEVIELISGEVIGTLIEAIISPSGHVEYLGILPEAWHKGGTVLSPKDIIGFDEGVILIERASRLASYQQMKLKKGFFTTKEMKQRIVIDRSGHLHGKPVAAVFDSSGRILELEVEKNLVLSNLPLGRIIAVGPKYIVVDLEKPGMGEAAEPETPKQVVELPPAKQKGESKPEVAASGNGDDIQAALSDESEPDLRREELLEFILGKPSPLTIDNGDGEIIVKTGQALTSPILNRLLEEGLLEQMFFALASESRQAMDEEPRAKS